MATASASASRRLNINGTNVTVGNTSNATQGRDLYRYTFVDTLTWQKGEHRFRFGTELEYAPGTGFWGFCDPACTVGFSPEFIRGLGDTGGDDRRAVPDAADHDSHQPAIS